MNSTMHSNECMVEIPYAATTASLVSTVPPCKGERAMATLDHERISAQEASLKANGERGRFYKRLSMLWTYVILTVMGLIVLFPFLWLITSSLKSEFQYYAIPIQWIPNPVQVSNFVEIFTQYHF